VGMEGEEFWSSQATNMDFFPENFAGFLTVYFTLLSTSNSNILLFSDCVMFSNCITRIPLELKKKKKKKKKTVIVDYFTLGKEA
jgi:hypothetical protein